MSDSDLERELARELDSLVNPWEAVPEEHRAGFETELAAELGRGHPLHGRPACAIARRNDCDDVLFRMDAPRELVVVHLTYTARPEEAPWPSARAYSSLVDVVADDDDEFE